MKKIITLLGMVTIVASVSAQYTDKSDDRYNRGKEIIVNNDNRGYDRDGFNNRERDFKISRINHEYDQRIREVNSRFFMNRFKKQQLIWRLEDQRKEDIRRVYIQYSSWGRHEDHHDDRDSRGHW